MSKGESWPMVNTGAKNPVEKQSFEERMNDATEFWQALRYYNKEMEKQGLIVGKDYIMTVTNN